MVGDIIATLLKVGVSNTGSHWTDRQGPFRLVLYILHRAIQATHCDAPVLFESGVMELRSLDLYNITLCAVG